MANSRTLQFTTVDNSVFSGCCVFTSRRLVTASNGGRCLALGSRTNSVPQHQLLTATAHKDNRSSLLTNSLTSQIATFHCIAVQCTNWLNSVGWKGPHRKHRFQEYFYRCVMQLSYGPRKDRRFPFSSLARVRNMLPRNGRCLRSHYLATGLHATRHVELRSWYLMNGRGKFSHYAFTNAHMLVRRPAKWAEWRRCP
jgi:hypothetical protein